MSWRAGDREGRGRRRRKPAATVDDVGFPEQTYRARLDNAGGHEVDECLLSSDSRLPEKAPASDSQIARKLYILV